MKPTVFSLKTFSTTLGTAIAATMLAAAPAQAADVGLTLDAGTTGLGAHLSIPLMPTVLNARIGANYFSYDFNASTSDVDYRFKFKLNTLDALLDWFPFGNEFRFSGGVVYNNNKLDAVGRSNSNGTYTINGNTYSAASAGQLDGHADFRKFAPYLGIGYGNAAAPGKGWGFSADVGVMFQGAATTSLSNSGCSAPAAACAQLATDVSAENARLADKANDYKVFPVVRVGATYRF